MGCSSPATCGTFPGNAVSPYGIEVPHPDTLLSDHRVRMPGPFRDAASKMRAWLVGPPISVRACLPILAGKGPVAIAAEPAHLSQQLQLVSDPARRKLKVCPNLRVWTRPAPAVYGPATSSDWLVFDTRQHCTESRARVRNEDVADEMKCPEILVDDVTVLRTLVEADADMLYSLVDQNRTHLREWLPWVDAHGSVKDSYEFIAGEKVKRVEGNSEDVWTFQEQEIDRSCWVCTKSAWTICVQMSDVGIEKESQGKGIADRCTRSLVGYGFGKLQLNRIVWRAAVGNTRSRRVAQRLGFHEEGVTRQAEFVKRRVCRSYRICGYEK